MPLLAVMALLVVACEAAEVELTTTTTVVVGTTEPPAMETTTTAGETPPTTMRGEAVSSFEVIVRQSVDQGEILHLVIPPGAYTEVDIENFIGDLIEANPDLWGAEVFDDEEALLAYQVPEGERSEEEQALIDRHHFASLVDRFLLRFQGPFSDLGEFIIGS